MAALHYFNPGHETAVLNSSPYYTPAANQLKMQRDLAFLPAWYAGSPDDLVWIEDDLPDDFIETVKPLRHLAKAISITGLANQENSIKNASVSPWGISPQSIRFFETINNKYGSNFILPEWKKEYTDLCSRQTARKCLESIIQSHPEIDKDILPEFYTTIEAIENRIQTSEIQLLAKAPYSSSGRGLLWLPSGKLHQSEKQIINGILKKQLTVSLEKVLDKQIDFAMLFHANGLGKIDYTGLSLFETGKKGVYDKNIVTSQTNIQNKLQTFIDNSLLENIKQTLIAFLSATSGFVYSGCIGVDMMIYSENGSFKLHPCVEINMRNTMGLLAFRLYQYFIHNNSYGYFKIDYNNKPGELLQKRHEMKRDFPAIFEDGRIKSGYLSLCPVKEDSKYWAYVVLKVIN